jgi:hypothetical protein
MKLKITRLQNFGEGFSERELAKCLATGKIEVVMKHRINVISIYRR